MKQKEIKALMVAPKEYPKVVTLKTQDRGFLWKIPLTVSQFPSPIIPLIGVILFRIG